MDANQALHAFPAAEKEAVLIQMLLRYMRGLDQADGEKYTIIVVMKTRFSTMCFQVVTLNCDRFCTIYQLKVRIAHSLQQHALDPTRLAICYESSPQELPDTATLLSLGLHEVTVMQANEISLALPQARSFPQKHDMA